MLRKHLYAFLLLLLGLSAMAQNESVATLKDRLGSAKDPAEAIRLLGILADSTQKSDIQALRPLEQQAQRLASGNLPDALKARAYLIAGKALAQLVSYDSAALFLDRSLALLDPVKQAAETAEAHHWKGFAKANQREFGAAAEHYYQAVEIWERIGRRRALADTYNQLSDMHAMQEDYQKSIDYAQQAIAQFKAIDAPELLADALNNLSYVHVLKGDYAGALQYATESLQIWERIAPGGLQVARASNSRGNAHKFLGNYDEALLDFERCRSIAEKLGFIRGVIAGTANKGHVLLMQKKYAEALPHTLRAIELMKESGDTRNLWENYMHLANIYSGMGDYQNAHRYQQLHHEEKEREYEQKIAALQGGLAEKYEAGQRAATIAIQEERIEKQRNSQRLLWGLAGLLLLTSFTIYMSLRSRQKANRLLGAANEQLEKKNRENELLLREIHHRVKNNLQTVSSLLNLQSAGIEDAAALAAVQESRNRVRSMSLIHQKLYQGEQLASVEMKDYFETMGQAMLQSFGQQTGRVALKIDMTPIDIDVDTAIPIGLIVNELITNSLKYAFPDQREGAIEISLRAEDDHTLALRIADNGVGNKVAEPSEWRQSSTGFGGRLVHLLVQQLGAQMEQNETGGYTTIIRFSNPAKAA